MTLQVTHEKFDHQLVDELEQLVASERRQSGRASRYAARRRLWAITRSERVGRCGRSLNGSTDGLVVVRSNASGAFFSGLATCGSVHACPVCSAKIRQRRSVELEQGIAAHLATGGSVLFVTATVRHGIGDDLRTTLAAVVDGWRSIFQGREGMRVKRHFRIVGTVRALEVTWGQANGWHPHVHALLFVDGQLEDDDQLRLRRFMYGRWAHTVERKGTGRPDLEHGLDLRPVTDGAGVSEYLAKLQDHFGAQKSAALEMTRQDIKTRRRDEGRWLPFDLLEPASQGEAWALKLWWTYEDVTKRRNALTYSPGLRARLGLGVDQGDEQLALEDENGVELLAITAQVWHQVMLRVPGAPAQLLDICERSGPEQGERFVADLIRRTASAP
jgi:hypothetical protein